MIERPTARLSYRDALASRELRALLAAQLVSVGGLSIAAVALTILVYRRTASPLLASLTFALSFLPYLLGAGLLSGLVDRVRPRGLVVACDSISALLMAAIAWPGLPLPILFALLLSRRHAVVGLERRTRRPGARQRVDGRLRTGAIIAADRGATGPDRRQRRRWSAAGGRSARAVRCW